MKIKFLVVMLCALMSFGFAACEGGGDDVAAPDVEQSEGAEELEEGAEEGTGN